MSNSHPTLWEPNILLETRKLTQFDAKALAHVVNGAEFEHRRLPGGGSDMRLLQCALPTSVLNRGIYAPAVLVRGTFSRSAITIGTMLRQQRQTLLNGVPVKSGTVQFYAENSEISYRAWPNATWLAFGMARERLLEFCLEHFDAFPGLPKTGIMHIEPSAIAMGKDLLTKLRDLDWSLPSIASLPNAGRIGESVESDLLARLAHLLCRQSANRAGGERRRVRHCREMIRDAMLLVERNPEEMLDLHSMSQATGLSPRTLQRTFQTEYGLCPQEWFRVERLNRVREDLLNGFEGGSVTHAATRWGFFHFSRFAQYYRELFGEKPSETMRYRRVALQTKAASA